MDYSLAVTEHFILTLRIDERSGLRAVHFLKNGTIVHKTAYSRESEWRYPMSHNGDYSCVVFTRSPDGSVARTKTRSLRFAKATPVPSAPKNEEFAVVGVNTVTGIALEVLAESKNIVEVIDPTRTLSGMAFGLPITHASRPDVLTIGHENYRSAVELDFPFRLSSADDNILTRALYRNSAIDIYRTARSFYLRGLLEGANFLQNYILFKFNSRIPYKAVIGAGTRLGVGGISAVVHPDARIGENCVIGQQVTIGSRGKPGDLPVIGDNVFIGPGSMCLGGKIGDNVTVGAGSVVLEDVPSNVVVAGVPAKVIRRKE
ncbi:serine O-acetyltransferase [Zhihengliuella halotolerans]|uniref:serine O-acetyltransferase n=1 Tax=Zhihengliuella halotolerans TaxID=370736 RepID=UPI000C808137|nr:DapH/DapD/GlmU-related protein [Zhihengliuella halotolerans]